MDAKNNIHYTYVYPELMEVLLVDASTIYFFGGRGTLKTSILIADKLIDWALRMPRSHIMLCAPTFEKVYLTILPAIQARWNERNIREGVHYFYKKNVKDFPQCYQMPREFNKSIHFYTGAVITFVSGYSSMSANGYSFNAVAVDEYKGVDKNKWESEMLPSLRGGDKYFSHLSCFQQQIYTTDFPENPKYFEAKKNMIPEEIETIKFLAWEHNKVKSQIFDLERANEDIPQELREQDNYYDVLLTSLRKKATHYVEVSSFANIMVLGEVLMKWYKTMPANVFKRAVLSVKAEGNDGKFYNLNDKILADLSRQSFFEGFTKLSDLSTKKDCRWLDLDSDLPLILTFDANVYFNCLIISQYDDYKKTLYVYQTLFVEQPEDFGDLIAKFDAFFMFAKNRNILLGYDHSFKNTNPNNISPDLLKKMKVKTIKDFAVAKLKKLSWNVKEIYTGQISPHHTRYLRFQELAKDNLSLNFRIRINREDSDLINALEATKVIFGKSSDEVRKYKGMEGKTGNAKDEPHIGDGLDAGVEVVMYLQNLGNRLITKAHTLAISNK